MERFECLRCLHCCFFSHEEESPVLFSWEVSRILELAEREGVSLENVEFKPIEVYRDSSSGRCVVVLYRMVVRGFCPFYDLASRSCIIHYEKPSACRMFPLLLEVPSGRLSVSGVCDWVEKNMWITKKGELLDKVFPGEMSEAKRVFVDYAAVVQRLAELGFKEKLGGTEACREVIGFEELLEETS